MYGKCLAQCLLPNENSMNVSHRRVQVQVFRGESLCRHHPRRAVRVGRAGFPSVRMKMRT